MQGHQSAVLVLHDLKDHLLKTETEMDPNGLVSFGMDSLWSCLNKL